MTFDLTVGASEVSRDHSGADDTRQQYRVALAKQLRVGLAENRQIDLRDAKHEVVVAFVDEPILAVWHEFAIRDAAAAHIFVAPSDFESGMLTMLSLTAGSRELDEADVFVDAHLTFGELVEALRQSAETTSDDVDTARFNVIAAPASVYHDGLAYSFAFSPPVDV